MNNEKDQYNEIFGGKLIGDSFTRGRMVGINIDNDVLVFTDGCDVKYYSRG